MFDQRRVSSFPDRPGVYLMKGEGDRLLYAGKAKSLRHRVQSYFRADLSPRIQAMLRRVEDITYLVTAGELEALILENNLIKEHHPRYNILLRDDKQYPYLKLNVKHPWPTLTMVRKIVDDGARYFGPFRGGEVRETLRFVKRLFPIRWCSDRDLRGRKRPCLLYHLGRCAGPCLYPVSRAQYQKMIEEITKIISGKTQGALAALRKEMEFYAGKLEFEKAALVKKRLRALSALAERQRVVTPRKVDRDIVVLERAGERAAAVILAIREGRLIREEHFFPRNASAEIQEAELMLNILTQYYSRAADIPRQIFLGSPATQLFKSWLAQRAGYRVEVKIPRRGEGRAQVEMARENARHLLGRDAAEEPAVPRRIEGFDIANIAGENITGGMVVFENGIPKKSDYRHFHVRTVVGHPDDVAAMFEVVRRRYRGSLARQLPRPDLILVDGGRGQLSATVRALKESGHENIPVMALAKKEEEIYQPGVKRPLRLSRRSPKLQLLQRVRDEAHRFARRLHIKIRGKFD